MVPGARIGRQQASATRRAASTDNVNPWPSFTRQYPTRACTPRRSSFTSGSAVRCRGSKRNELLSRFQKTGCRFGSVGNSFWPPPTAQKWPSFSPRSTHAAATCPAATGHLRWPSLRTSAERPVSTGWTLPRHTQSHEATLAVEPSCSWSPCDGLRHRESCFNPVPCFERISLERAVKSLPWRQY
jgi:hypothetical protein